MYLTRDIRINRGGKWDDSFIERARKLCVMGATLEVLSVAFDVSPSTITKWKETKPGFERAIKQGMLEINEEVSFNFRRACTGYYYEVDEMRVVDKVLQKVTVKKYMPPDTWAARWWLIIHMPELWGNAEKNREQNTVININKIDMNILSTDELMLMKSIIQKNNMLPDNIGT